MERPAPEEDAVRPLVVACEPIVALPEGGTVGWQARPTAPADGVLALASRYLSEAERAALEVEVERRVLDEACAAAAGRDEGFACVALCEDDLRREDLPAWVEAVLVRHALAPVRLVLEVAEGPAARAAAGDQVLRRALERLSRLGARLAVGDVGLGSVPDYLGALPVSMLKLDPRVVRGTGHLTRALAALACAHGLASVATGVQRPADLARLAALGVDLAQGPAAAAVAA